MPPSAWTSLPVFGAKAPGKAPFSWPNSSLSMMFGGIALQSSDSSGPLARRLAAWIARATVSLPVPGFADDQDRQAVARRLWRRRRARRGTRAPRRPAARARAAARAFPKRAQARPRRGGGRRWRRAPRAAAPARPAGPGNRTRRRASPRPRAETLSPCERTMTGRFGAVLAKRRRSAAGLCSRPSCRGARPGLRGRAGPGAGRRRFRSSAAPTTLQPARAAMAEISRRSSAFGVEQQERACRFFAHFRPFAPQPSARGVKGALSCQRDWGLGERRRGLLWTPRDRFAAKRED